MMVLSIRHRTAYRYHQTVQLGQHRLMLRPRESRDLRLISSAVTISPQASLTWAHDVFGNTIATASFDGWSDSLIIESAVQLELFAPVWPEFGVAATATHYPFAYSDSELTDLGALAAQQYADPQGRLRAWAHGFVASRPTETLALLQDLSKGVSRWISYQSRDDEGTQTPVETLDRGWGSCRDFAVLFVEAARSLGFGARIVSGYVFLPSSGGEMRGSSGDGSTHAWAEVYVPGAGWVTFDPTNRAVGGRNLIPVAVARHINQAMPVTGSFTGMTNAFRDMQVEVSVTS